MAHESGLITYPVSFADVNATLGTSHTDLKTMCKDSNIKWYSKYKPTSYTGIGFALGTSGIEDYHRGAPIDGLHFGCGLRVPSFSVATTATVTFGNGTTTLVNYLENYQTSFGQYGILSLNASALLSQWEKPNITVGRLTDFHRYTHNTPRYNLGDKPFYCDVALPQAGGRLVIDASATITYNYNNKADGVGCWLGVNDLFSQENGQGLYGGVSITINGFTAIRFFTVVVWSAETNKMLISRQAFTSITDEVDSTTGRSDVRSVAIPTAGVVGENFPQGSTVYVAPCIVGRNANGNYVFFNLNCERLVTRSFTLRDDTPIVQGVHVSRITATITYAQVSGRTFDIYFNGATAMSVTCTGASTNTQTNKLFFTQETAYITPADATGNMSEQIGITLGSNYDSDNGYRYTRITTNSPQGYFINGSNLSYNNFRSRITFSGTGSSSKVGISIPIYHKGSSNVMVRSFINLTFTIDPTKTGTNTAVATWNF